MRTVPIDVYKKNELISEGSNWELGIEVAINMNYTHVWGLVHEGYWTQMRYGLPYADPYKAIKERTDKIKEEPGLDDDPEYSWLNWYFDVGNRIYTPLTDLEKACDLLGMRELV